MAEPIELTKKVKEFLKDDYPFVEYIGTYKGQPAYEVSAIPPEEFEYCLGAPFYFVANPDDLTKSSLFTWYNHDFRQGLQGDPDIVRVPKPDPLANPVELSKQLKAYLKDSYRYIRYVGRYKGHPTYAVFKQKFGLSNYNNKRFCVVFNNDIAQLKYFDWTDVDFFDDLQYARYYEDI